jgi:hypothetical protein
MSKPIAVEMRIEMSRWHGGKSAMPRTAGDRGDDRSVVAVAEMGVTALRNSEASSCQDSNEDASETVCSSFKISG